MPYTVIAFLSALYFRKIISRNSNRNYESSAIKGIIPSSDLFLSEILQGICICYDIYKAKDGLP